MGFLGSSMRCDVRMNILLEGRMFSVCCLFRGGGGEYSLWSQVLSGGLRRELPQTLVPGPLWGEIYDSLWSQVFSGGYGEGVLVPGPFWGSDSQPLGPGPFRARGVTLSALADPGFGQGGGPRNFFRDFADVAKRSQVSEASQYWQGVQGPP